MKKISSKYKKQALYRLINDELEPKHLRSAGIPPAQVFIFA